MSFVVNIHYCNVKNMPDSNVEFESKKLPHFFTTDIDRIKNNGLKKAKTLARLMLIHCLKETDSFELIQNWNLGAYRKPRIEGWYEFNISHSGDWVLIAYSKFPVGIDIEQNSGYKNDIIEYFHPDEKTYIYDALDKGRAFFEVWTRKEAFLKATGTGITAESLFQKINCLPDEILFDGNNFFIQNFDIAPGYLSHICHQGASVELMLKEFKM